MLIDKSGQFIGVVIVVSMAMIAISNDSVARIYKWVDDNGKTHYTQSPPPGDIEAEEINISTKVDVESAQKELESQKEKADKLQAERQKQAEQDKKEKEKIAKQEARCKQAKLSLASYERPRVNYVDENGNRSVMEEEKRLEGLEKAKKEVSEACK